MAYQKVFTPQYEDGWENLPLETTPITADALNDYDAAIEHVENYLSESDFVDWETFNVLGAKNLLNNVASTQTKNGVTFTVNDDKSVTVSGTADINSDASLEIAHFTIKAGTYILSALPSDIDGGGNKIRCWVSGGGAWIGWTDDGANSTPSTLKHTFAQDTDIRVNLVVYKGKSYSTTFKPMIRLDSISDATYEPYAMTNRELTEAVQQGGGSGTLAGLTDTNITTPTDGQFLVYDSASSKWVNMTIPNAESEGF